MQSINIFGTDKGYILSRICDDNNDKHSECQENSSKETSERKKYEDKIKEQKFNVWVTADLKGDTQISEMEETTTQLAEDSQPCAEENV